MFERVDKFTQMITLEVDCSNYSSANQSHTYS